MDVSIVDAYSNLLVWAKGYQFIISTHWGDTLGNINIYTVSPRPAPTPC